MRLHELAKEIGVSSKELLALSREIGLNIKSHSSNLAAGEESILRFAMKQELEERAAEEAAKKEAEAAALAEKEEATRAEAEAEAAKAEETPAADQAQGLEEPAAVAASEEGSLVATAVADEGEAGEGGEDTMGDLQEAATLQTEGEGGEALTPAAASTTALSDEAGTEGDVAVSPAPKKAKKKTKIRKPPKRVGATILGRIDLTPSLDELKKKKAKEAAQAREKESRVADPALVPTGVSDEASSTLTEREQTPPKEPEEKGFEDKVKLRRYIKPKQQPVFFDPEDDPLLQGIRIRHWDKHARVRRPAWRPGSKTKKRLRRPELTTHKKVGIVPPVSVKDLSQLLGIKAQDILFSLMKQGTMVHINSMLDEEAILQISLEFNREIEILEEKDAERDFLVSIEEQVAAAEEEDFELRPPIVAFLGHVDHGKTSLLDAIRHANVQATEDGGITQHVSAYKVQTPSGHSVVFLDTPGHRAFTEMRARGANVTDIVVLVVAADDGVMPQTEEAIQHAQAAGVSMVVAINKVDKANANPMRVKQQLAGLGIMTEDWGGEVGCVEVSALKQEGLDELLDRLVLEAEIQELKCNPKQHATGVVFEARKDVEVGNVVTLLVQDGTMTHRDYLIAGDSTCRIRAMINDQGIPVEEAGPSTPINVIGFDKLPEAGEKFVQVDDGAKAREIVEVRKAKQRAAQEAPENRYAITLENLFESIEAGKIKEIRIVLKADVKGTLEVLTRSLEELQHEEVKIKLLREGLGGITEDDVLLALASNAVIVGFHSLPDDKARRMAEEHGVDIRTYRVIYKLLDEMRAAMEGALDPIKKENVTAHLEIREIFKSSRIGSIAGCMVLDGTIRRNDRVRVMRDDGEIFNGEIASLKRFTEDQREVKEGFECGLKIEGFDDIREGDIIESYEIVEEKRTLELE